jgi:biotin carboxylase
MDVEPSVATVLGAGDQSRTPETTYDSGVPRALLLLPSATYKAHDFLAAGRALGVEVVVASDRRQALTGALGDGALTLKLHEPEAAAERIAALHERRPLDAVVAADDGGVLTAAHACRRLGLRGNPPRAAVATRDKAALRHALDTAEVPQPPYRVAEPADDVAELARAVGLPCVVKPLSMSASRGVIRADDPGAAARAAERARAILAEAGLDPATERLVVERFVPGAEVAVEGLMRAGRLEVLAVFDKPDPLEGPFFEETLLVTPSRLPFRSLDAVERTAGAAAAALGLREGPLHAELRLRPSGEVVVLELAARTIGGLCARALRFGLGVSLEELVLRHALGLSLDGLRRERAAAGVMMLPIPASGVLAEVAGQDRALAVPGIVGLELSIHPGRPLRPLPEGDRYLGFLFARAQAPEDVERALREAHAILEVRVARAGEATAADAAAPAAPLGAGSSDAARTAASAGAGPGPRPPAAVCP